MSKKCKLCNENDLENVGSHIFTESIIRTALNQEGITKRVDKEIIFEISSEKIGLDYFGMGVQPEKVEEITGEPISDEQIAENKNPFINRNLVCRHCEKRFGPIESTFALNIYSKIVKKTTDELEKDSCNFISFKDEKWLALQFVIINIWRASASNHDDWKLLPEQEEYLRTFILKTASDDIKSIINKTYELRDEIKEFHFALNYFMQDSENLTENGVLIDNSKEPFFILLNRLSIIFDFKPINETKLPELLFDIINENIICIISNTNENELRIGINFDKQRKELFNRIALKLARQIIEKFNSTFSELHRRFFGFYPTEGSSNFYSETMRKYVVERNGKIVISEMLELLVTIINQCGRNYY